MSKWIDANQLWPPLNQDVLARLEDGTLILARVIVVWHTMANVKPGAKIKDWQSIECINTIPY